MPKSQADRQAELLERNAKAIAKVEERIEKSKAKATTENVEKAEAKVTAARKSLENAISRLETLKSGSPELAAEKARLEAERTWIENMPVGAVAGVAGTDQVFVENAEPVGDDAVYDDEDDSVPASPGRLEDRPL